MASPLLVRKTQLAAAIESEKGTAETLEAADAAIYAENVRFIPPSEVLVRNPLRSTLTPICRVPGAPIAQITCRVEAKGSGTATTAPSIGVLWTGCGLNESVNTDNVTYVPDSDDADSETLTMAVYQDGVCHKIYGARGECEATFEANQLVYFDFTFTGIYSATTDTALLTGITYEDTVPVRWYNGSIALDFATAWSTAVVPTLTWRTGNTISIRSDANATYGLSYAIITNREPGGTLTVEKPLIATENFYSHFSTPTTGSLTWLLGSATGNKITWTAPKINVIGIEEGDRDGIATLGINYLCTVNSAGDDEMTITCA
jgi:hypothetical protein